MGLVGPGQRRGEPIVHVPACLAYSKIIKNKSNHALARFRASARARTATGQRATRLCHCVQGEGPSTRAPNLDHLYLFLVLWVCLESSNPKSYKLFHIQNHIKDLLDQWNRPSTYSNKGHMKPLLTTTKQITHIVKQRNSAKPMLKEIMHILKRKNSATRPSRHWWLKASCTIKFTVLNTSAIRPCSSFYKDVFQILWSIVSMIYIVVPSIGQQTIPGVWAIQYACLVVIVVVFFLLV